MSNKNVLELADYQQNFTGYTSTYDWLNQKYIQKWVTHIINEFLFK